MSVLLQQPEHSPRTCAHDAVEWLGSEGTAVFYICAVCGSVVIRQAGQGWALRRTTIP